MVDPESVFRRLREMDRRLSRLKAIEEMGRDHFLATKELQAEAERHLQIAIQSAIDIALHVVAEDSPQTPEDYASAFSSLSELDVIGRELADELRLAVGLRNIIVHAYLDVDPERVWEHLGRLELLESFASDIEKYMS